MDARTQGTGALAVHDADTMQAALAAFREVLVKEGGNIARLKRMQIEFTRDGNGDGLAGSFGIHSSILAAFRLQATKTRPFRGGFLTHTH